MIKFILLVLNFCIPFIIYAQDFRERVVLGREHARKQVHIALKGIKSISFSDTLIKTKEEAIAFAEPVLFKKFGKKRITGQRPYEIYFIEGYWFIAGTLPKGYLGGTFEIILKSEKGQVISIAHYQ